MTLAIGLILFVEVDQPIPFTIIAGVALLVLVVGNLIGYPLLVVFLIWAGVTTLRRESRSLANMLALLMGIGLVFLPATLRWLAPPEVVRTDVVYSLQYGLHLGAILLITYVSCCFGAFAVASLAYRWRKPRQVSEAVIVLESGLVNGKVSPLLAGRIRRGIAATQDREVSPMLITSGGQGADEPRSEGAAMRQYAIDQGVPPARVVAEERSATTQENLLFSRELLADPNAPITVVTSSYHVFRAALLTRALGLRAHVVGAPTAWYYLPGAFIREFIAVMRDDLRIHVLAISGIVMLTIAFTAWIVPALGPGPSAI